MTVAASDEGRVGTAGAERETLAIVIDEKECAALEDFDLSVVLGAVELAVTSEKVRGE